MFRTMVVWLALCLAGAGVNAQEYTVQVGDRLQISVLEDSSLNTAALVRPDGRITVPLAGTVNAAGLTPEAVASAISGRLARDFVSPPTVTVAVTSLGDPTVAESGDLASVYVIGQVRSPGAYQVALPLDALRFLATVGGPGTFAAVSRIQVRRRDETGAESVLLFDYEAVEDGLVPSDSIMLRDGDVIVVPERRLFE